MGWGGGETGKENCKRSKPELQEMRWKQEEDVANKYIGIVEQKYRGGARGGEENCTRRKSKSYNDGNRRKTWLI